MRMSCKVLRCGGWLPLIGALILTLPPSAVSQAPPAVKFPRRLLAIRPNNYLYANPVTSGFRDDKGEFKSTVHEMVRSIADKLHIDPSQFVDLSDGIPGNAARPPLKSVIEEAVEQLVKTSRAQDRIIVLFAGHAVEVDDVPYLVPLDGAPEDGSWKKETLVPLSWLYDRLARCKARQKVLILDGCRFDPDRGRERPGGVAMGAKLDAALRKPPAGVEVWSACQQEQFSYEFEIRGLAPGGVFLNQLHETLARSELAAKQRPEDALPLPALHQEVADSVRRTVQDAQDAPQVPRLTGTEAAGGAAFDPQEPLPPRPGLQKFPPAGGDHAAPGDVLSILRELNAFAPARTTPTELASIRLEALPAFRARVLENYKADAQDTPFRRAIRKAADVLKKHAGACPDQFVVAPANENQFRTQIIRLQKDTAAVILELEETLEELTKASADRDQEASRRWQAHYDFAVARLLNRLAYVYEYNSALGSLRRELPPRDPAIHQGWRLVPRPQPAGDRTGKILVKNARQILLNLIRDHAGTPWEVLARRDLETGLGLEWRPVRFGE